MPKRNTSVLTRYGVANPQAVKLKILWVHMQALVGHVYEVDKPNSAGKQLLQQYQSDWKEAERLEN